MCDRTRGSRDDVGLSEAAGVDHQHISHTTTNNLNTSRSSLAEVGHIFVLIFLIGRLVNKFDSDL